MVDWSNSERLRGFCDRQTDRQTDGQTDICNCRVAFATENAPFFWSSVGIKSLVNVPSFVSDTSCPEPWDSIS